MDNLPVEIIYKILYYLSFKDLYWGLCETSQRYRQIILTMPNIVMNLRASDYEEFSLVARHTAHVFNIIPINNLTSSHDKFAFVASILPFIRNDDVFKWLSKSFANTDFIKHVRVVRQKLKG